MKFLKFSFILLVVGIFLTLFSCNRHLVDSSNTKKELVIFPPPPDTTRIQFLTSISSSQDILKPRSKFAEFVLGKEEVISILKPYGVDIKSGSIFATDLGILGIVKIDLEKQDFSYFIPKGKGILRAPINCFVDDNNFLYVTDAKRKQVVIYNKDRDYVNAIGDTGQFKPIDVFVYDHKIFVSNIKNHNIYVYGADGSNTLLYTFPDSEPGNEDFLYSPLNIFVRNDKVYVSDIGGFDVKVYTLEGKYLQTVGSYGKLPGQFSRNKGVAVDKDGNIYVIDASFENAQIFNKDGKLLMFFGGPYKGPGYMYLPTQITIDYDNLSYFQKYVDPSFNLKYIILVVNQFSPDKISVYGAVELKK